MLLTCARGSQMNFLGAAQSQHSMVNLEGRSMAIRTIGWGMGLVLVGSALAAQAMADAAPFNIYNPLGVYVGAGLGRGTTNDAQFDRFGDFFHHYDGNPLGWNAVVGIRPIPFLGAEAEYLDFGNTHAGAGREFVAGGLSQQFLGGEVHDRAAAVFAVGYLPLPIPWIEPFGKLGFGQIWQNTSSGGTFNGEHVFDSETTHPSGTAYGGGLQFHFQQLAVRAQYERISGNRSFGGWDNPSLVSVGVNWTF
jgi:opacity protein-like surface antigen